MTEVSTPRPMLPPEPEASVQDDGHHGSHPGRWLVGSLVVIAGLFGLMVVVPAQALGRVVPGHALIDEGTVANKPGSAQPTTGRVSVDGFEVFHPTGEILVTTVAVDSRVSIWDWLRAEIDDDIELKPRELVFGTRTAEENRQRNLELMNRSKENAVIAAMARLGIAVIEETGVGFESIVEGGPAESLLVVGDVIIGVDGVEITGFESLRAQLLLKTPGETGILTLDNIDTLGTRDETIVWGQHPDGLEGGFIGIGDVTVRADDLPLPFEVGIDSGRIGGPSAGLAFSLAIIDLLTEGELTGGQPIAVTGTISVGGDVGNVGGVGQKAAAAHGAGAVAFIVPAASLEVAREHARDMPVIGVATLEEAIEALADLGGDTADLHLDLP